MKNYLLGIILLILTVIGLTVLNLPDSNLHIIACDVGQGDAILITFKTTQILTDGGLANGKVINCLTKYMPFWDKEIEIVVNTHPQLDHYGGLIEIFKKYKVDTFIANALNSSALEYQVLTREVGGQGTKVVSPHSGMVVRLGLLSYDIFWPTTEFISFESGQELTNKLNTFNSKRDPNDFSIQAVVSFGDFSALLTGDMGKALANGVIPNLPIKTIDYIKIPHHGSKYGITQNYLDMIDPGVAVISVGKKNSYGHPTSEILNLLKDRGIKTYRTDQDGDIEVVTDGKSFWVK